MDHGRDAAIAQLKIRILRQRVQLLLGDAQILAHFHGLVRGAVGLGARQRKGGELEQIVLLHELVELGRALAQHVKLFAELDRILGEARGLLAFKEGQLRCGRNHLRGAINADQNPIAFGRGLLAGLLLGHDRQKRIAARERRQVHFRIERAIGAKEHVHAGAKTHHRKRGFCLGIENDRIANSGQTELIHGKRHEVGFGQKRKRIGHLAYAQAPMAFLRKRLKLAIEEDLAKRLLIAGASGRHGVLQGFQT